MKKLDPENVSLAILHHSAYEPAPKSLIFDEIKKVRGWHTDRGFDDIGYNFVIKGKFWQEARPMEFQGAHCRGSNHISIGFCVLGDLTKRRPTWQEVCATTDAILYAEYQLRKELDIFGHNDFANTLCPGPELVQAVQKRMKSFR